MKNRAGEYRTNLTGELLYKSFLPNSLPPSPPIEFDEETINLLAKANRSIGILEGMSTQIPSIEVFASMFVRKEALLSVQIEGTQATLDNILDPNIEENIEENIKQNAADVINYIEAWQYASARLSELPICNRLLKETHEILMQGVRNEEKSPGEFRRSQNWMGSAGCTLNGASYIPPNPVDMLEAMSDLEKFINREDGLDPLIDPLIKVALIHYQFEIIHPFLDGNGRIGRLLIALYLLEKRLLSHEVLYISYFLKRNSLEYYYRLTEVRANGDFEQWIKFFLLAAYESAEDAIDTIERIIKLHDRSIEVVKNTGKASKTVRLVLNYLEGCPLIDIKKTSVALGLSFNTVSNAVNKLVELGILRKTENVRRSRVFAYEEYLNILRKDT